MWSFACPDGRSAWQQYILLCLGGKFSRVRAVQTSPRIGELPLSLPVGNYRPLPLVKVAVWRMIGNEFEARRSVSRPSTAWLSAAGKQKKPRQVVVTQRGRREVTGADLVDGHRAGKGGRLGFSGVQSSSVAQSDAPALVWRTCLNPKWSGVTLWPAWFSMNYVAASHHMNPNVGRLGVISGRSLFE